MEGSVLGGFSRGFSGTLLKTAYKSYKNFNGVFNSIMSLESIQKRFMMTLSPTSL